MRVRGVAVGFDCVGGVQDGGWGGWIGDGAEVGGEGEVPFHMLDWEGMAWISGV